MSVCPIQIIDDKYSTIFRWITFDKYIHRQGLGGYYNNIVSYYREHEHNIGLLEDLISGRNKCRIATIDIIRNPTLEEFEEINDLLKKYGYKLNLKTYQLAKI